MGTVLTSIGLNAADQAAEWICPVEAPLVYANFFGAASALRRNLATGGQVKMVGAPTSMDHYALFDANNYIDTGILELPAFTLMAAMAIPGTNNGNNAIALSSTSAVGGHIGSNLYGRKGSPGLSGNVSTVNTASGATQDAVTSVDLAGDISSTWHVNAVRFDGTTLTLSDLTGGRVGQNAIGGTRQLSGVSYLVGASRVGGEQVALSSALIFNRSLSDMELASVTPVLRKYLALGGIII